MKQGTFEKAQELNIKIEDIDQALMRIEKNTRDCNGFPINLSFSYCEESEALKQSVIKYLQSKRKIFKREFDNLK